MGRFAIACYRPKPGREEALLDLVHQHVPILRSEGLVTDRRPCLMRAKDGTIIEVFEWKSEEAKNEAHGNEAVRWIWELFAESAEFPALTEIDEARAPFPNFSALD